MGFRKSPEEIAGIRAAFTDSIYVRTRTLTILFETKPEDIANVLPPPLEPTGRPFAACGLGEFNSSVGRWKGGGLFIPARYGDLRGQYVAAMYGDLDSPCFYGRAKVGEPKKLARVVLEMEGDRMRGSLTRHGVTVIEMEARLTQDRPVEPGLRPSTRPWSAQTRSSGGNFNFKFALKPDASGFEWGPVLMYGTGGISETLVAKSGDGTLQFGDSPHDPLSDLEIVNVRGASYSETNAYGDNSVETVAEVDPDAFFPFALTIYDALDVFHAQAKAQIPAERLAEAAQLRVTA